MDLRRKIAGVEVRIWIVLGIVAVGLGLYLRSRSPKAAEEDATDATDQPDAGEIVPNDQLAGYDSYYGTLDPISGGGVPNGLGGSAGAIGLTGDATIRIIQGRNRGGGKGTGTGGRHDCRKGMVWDAKRKRCVPGPGRR